ncbi:DUF2854 domain-containing protein [Nostoc sp. FACHB-888]|uniref:DUF2854 domain-containing protein n=1 Tax=Nostoc sp. FACHB-888 TaxID=2692842 RepID=UPI00168680B7|nr:DUF2854 domain-containing protein [Nostoc sp. FACHB-888]MBD2246147.1 DUF2854 domain-containing protein [Nostoc sp. FACHB-888]MCC5648942.1 DUF2854 domain-containing protein [Nostoc sp. XA013]
MLRKISLGTLGLTIGGILTIIGFVAYADNNATLNLVGFFYGIPLLLGGLALKANELKPVPFSQITSPSALILREQQATDTQNKIRKDITRYRYGQDAHLDTTLSFLGLSPSDQERPTVTGLRETEINGKYALILEFDSPLVPIDVWQKKQEKMTNYFGPGLEVEITQPSENTIELALIHAPQQSLVSSQ